MIKNKKQIAENNNNILEDMNANKNVLFGFGVINKHMRQLVESIVKRKITIRTQI